MGLLQLSQCIIVAGRLCCCIWSCCSRAEAAFVVFVTCVVGICVKALWRSDADWGCCPNAAENWAAVSDDIAWVTVGSFVAEAASCCAVWKGLWEPKKRSNAWFCCCWRDAAGLRKLRGDKDLLGESVDPDVSSWGKRCPWLAEGWCWWREVLKFPRNSYYLMWVHFLPCCCWRRTAAPNAIDRGLCWGICITFCCCFCCIWACSASARAIKVN